MQKWRQLARGEIVAPMASRGSAATAIAAGECGGRLFFEVHRLGKRPGEGPSGTPRRRTEGQRDPSGRTHGQGVGRHVAPCTREPAHQTADGKNESHRADRDAGHHGDTHVHERRCREPDTQGADHSACGPKTDPSWRQREVGGRCGSHG